MFVKAGRFAGLIAARRSHTSAPRNICTPSANGCLRWESWRSFATSKGGVSLQSILPQNGSTLRILLLLLSATTTGIGGWMIGQNEQSVRGQNIIYNSSQPVYATRAEMERVSISPSQPSLSLAVRLISTSHSNKG